MQTRYSKKFSEKSITFYREDTSWYADVPNVPKKNNLMVAGSDLFLEYLSKGNNKVTLTIQEDKPESFLFSLRRILHDRWGGTYLISGDGKKRLCWLCNVTHSVLGEHPKHIYITEIQ